MKASSIAALAFLIGVIFDIYIYILLVRLLLQKLGASFYHPLSQFVLKFTDPIVKPVRKIVPGYRGIDYAIVFLMLVIEIIGVLLLLWLRQGVIPEAAGTIVIAIGYLLRKVINLFFIVVIVAAIMSWLPNLRYGAFYEIVSLLARPVMRPAQRIIPPISGFDISPIVVLIVLQVISILVANTLIVYGYQLAF